MFIIYLILKIVTQQIMFLQSEFFNMYNYTFYLNSNCTDL